MMKVNPKGKMIKKKMLGGANKLTNPVIDQLVKYYTIAVKRCAGGTVKQLKDEIMAIFYHCSSTDISPKHHLCPRGPDTYCFFNLAMNNNEKP